MKSFDELENHNLKWVQPSAWKSTYYELQTETGEAAASIRFNSWRGSAEVEALGHRWCFERKGFWKPRIEVISAGTGELYGTYTYNQRMLHLQDGRTFEWKQANFWGNKWAWVDAYDLPLLGFQTGGSFRFNSDLRIDPEAVGLPVMPVLIFLGWYLLVKQREQNAASATIVVAT